jgi:flagellar basal body-associated protein FliL
MTGITLFMAYIMFAPDSLPKPFYLNYADDTLAAEGEATPPAEAPPATTGGHTSAEVAGSEGSMPISASLEIRPGEGIMIDTGTKIVNLIDPTGRKYLRVGIVLEFAPTDLRFYTMPHEEKVAFVTTFEEEMNAKMPIINDVIITLLSNQTFEGVYTASGKEELRTTLLNTINTQIPEQRVIFVYFTEFVVQ